MPKTFEMEIAWIDSPAEGLITCGVRRQDREMIAARAGQFFMMHFEHDGEKCTRSYSIANTIDSEEVESIELCIALVPDGIASSIIKNWDVGSRFDATGPHGRFCLRPEQNDLVLVATGTGIAPFRSMTPQIESRLEQGSKIDVLYGAKRAQDFLYQSEFDDLQARYPSTFKFWPCVSREDVVPPLLSGRVQTVFESQAQHWEERTFFLCGNPNMVNDVKARLQSLGVDRRSIKTEAYT